MFNSNGSLDSIVSGLIERIGLDEGKIKHKVAGKEKQVISKDMASHKVAIQNLMELLQDDEYGVIKDLSEISGVGHRVVHGGENFKESVLIDDSVIAGIEDCSALSPLHNPANLLGIKACQELLPNVPQVAVFDTAFHQTMPKKAYLYGIDYEQYEKNKIRKYGFHGTSHRFVSAEAAKLMGKNLEEVKLITCHLGNGCSLTAVKNGESVDTSMGLTPLEGVLMGTRSGDMDPYIPLHIMKSQNKTVDEVNEIMNKKSGFYGLCGKADMRDVMDAADNGDEKAKTALDIFFYRIAKYIGSFAAAMNGVDAIVFTGGIGENCGWTRKEICSYVEFMGVNIDDDKNGVRGEIADVTTPDSKVKVLVVPTNEELVIARDTVGIIS